MPTTEIRVLKDCRASLDGITKTEYKKGQRYMLEGEKGAFTARNLVKQGLAVLVGPGSVTRPGLDALLAAAAQLGNDDLELLVRSVNERLSEIAAEKAWREGPGPEETPNGPGPAETPADAPEEPKTPVKPDEPADPKGPEEPKPTNPDAAKPTGDSADPKPPAKPDEAKTPAAKPEKGGK